MNWLTATEVKTALDQRRRKPMMRGAGRTSVASRASETCPVPLTRLRLNDLRLGRAFFYKRRCGTAPALRGGEISTNAGKAKQTLRQCRPDASSGNGCWKSLLYLILPNTCKKE